MMEITEYIGEVELLSDHTMWLLQAATQDHMNHSHQYVVQ